MRAAYALSALPALSGFDLHAHLRALGYSDFRPGQRETIELLLERGRLLLVAPTGGGKSLTYQLPALLFEGTTLVISPLIALMHDQVQALAARGVPATYLASTLAPAELRARTAELARGAYRIAYVAPERLRSPGFAALVARLGCPIIAIDEAHCISEWGHDFRPEYLDIGRLIERLPRARVLACTATATPVVRDEIISRLGLPVDTPQIVHGFARPNLVLEAAEVTGRRDRNRRVDAALLRALGAKNDNRGTAIVYSPTRKMAEAEAQRLQAEGWAAESYHAGLAPGERRRVQEQFAEGSVRVVVATNAFGMGIDRPDVRAVIHLGPPGSIEAYYQEVGRAGRDGELAWGRLLYSSQDLPLRRRLIERGAEGETVSANVVEHKWNLFLELIRWADGGTCRHDAILQYFGDAAEVLDGCGHCDVCTAVDAASDADSEEVRLVARKALSGVARVHGRFGLGMATKVLKGIRDAKITQAGLDAVTTFGALAEYSEEWITKLLRRCVTAGWVDFAGGDRPVVVLTERGRLVMTNKVAARIVLPPRTRSEPPAKPRSGTSTRSDIVDVLDSDGERLFEELRHHRLEIAREDRVPPYVVASDRTLRDVARLRPRNRDELLLVHGIGPTKAERYGDALLDVVRRFLSR